MSDRRIRFLLQHPHGRELSGVVTYVNSMARALESLPGVEVKILSTKTDPLRARLRAVKSADVVLLNSNDLAMAVSARLLRKPLSLKYHFPFWLSTISSYTPLTFNERLKQEIIHIWVRDKRWMKRGRSYARLAVRLLTLSLVQYPSTCSEFTARSFDMKRSIEFLPNPFDFGSDPGAREVHEAKFLFVGRLSAEKGVDLIFDAVEKLPSSVRSTVSVLIAGDGPASEALRDQSEMRGLTSNVRFLGRLTQDEVLTELSTCLAAIFPSRWQEPAPYVPLEAASQRVVSIVSRVGGLTETAGPHAYFFEMNDADELRDQILRCVNQPEVALERGRLARTAAIRRYSADVAVKALVHSMGLEDLLPQTNAESASTS